MNPNPRPLRSSAAGLIAGLSIVVASWPSGVGSQESARPEPDRNEIYQEEDSLKLHIFLPEGHQPGDQRAAIVFFFGGGWVGGDPGQFFPHCRHLADQGMVAISAEYRVRNRHQTTPFDCVRDGKAAIRWIRSEAASLGVDPKRIAAGGGSAGGHVAAATATVPGLDPNPESAVSCRPNALVLFNPVYDNGPMGYGYDRVAERYREISPMHNIQPGIPPAIVFLGTKDPLIPVATAKEFKRKMEAAGARSELILYDGEAHGFFNYGRKDNVFYEWTVQDMDRFLRSLGYL